MIDTQRLLKPSPTTIKEARSSIESEKDYHDHLAISQSDLKYLEKSPRKFKEEKLMYEPDDEPHVDMGYHPKMGTMVEQRLLEPDRFEENFIEQSEMETPSSPNQKEFVSLILEGYTASEAHDIAYANSTESKATKLYESLADYIQFQYDSQGKGVYDQDERETLLRVCGDIMSHRKANALLLEDSVWENTWNQVPLLGEVGGVFCKGLPDRVVQSGPEKFIIVDLKVTSKPLYNFGYWFGRRKYHFQFAMYSRLLVLHAKMYWDKEISVTPIAAISSKEKPYDTIVRTIPYDLILNAAKQIDILLERLKWHIREDEWERRKDYYDDGYPELQYNKSDLPGLQI